MAVISQIKATSDNVNYNIRDDYSTWGGRNYLLGTNNWYGWNKSSIVTFNEEIASWPDSTTQAWTVVRQAKIPQTLFLGNDWTLSFEYRSDDWSDTTRRYLDITFYGSATENGSRTKYLTLLSPNKNTELFSMPASTWQKTAITIENIQLSDFVSGSGDVNYCGVEFYNYTLNPIDIRHVKLEGGTKATDWSPAPEDIARFIGNETIELYSE